MYLRIIQNTLLIILLKKYCQITIEKVTIEKAERSPLKKSFSINIPENFYLIKKTRHCYYQKARSLI